MTQGIVVRPLDGLEFRDLPGRRASDPLQNVVQEAMSARFVILPPGLERSPHVHPHSPEFFVVLHGSGRVWCEGDFHPVRAGDTVFIPQGSAHATIPDPSGEMRLICFFPHGDLSRNLAELPGRVDGNGA